LIGASFAIFFEEPWRDSCPLEWFFFSAVCDVLRFMV